MPRAIFGAGQESLRSGGPAGSGCRSNGTLQFQSFKEYRGPFKTFQPFDTAPSMRASFATGFALLRTDGIFQLRSSRYGLKQFKIRGNTNSAGSIHVLTILKTSK